ncbi:MAG TPA: dipeptidase PepE [Phycisphaerae bacterium]|nr:dipeptidase PepE [Phycisphaerae bacterium]
MKILLGSGGFRTDERKANLAAMMQKHFGQIKTLLFVPYALHDHDAYEALITDNNLHGDYEIQGIHRTDDPKRAVEAADGIYVGGGNTFRLLKSLYDLDLLDVIRDRVHAGMPYLGISAGTNVACPTMMTTNDMPICMPPSFDALGLVPFQINAHYFFGSTYIKESDTYCQHFGETRDDRLREFHEMNDAPVVGLWEGGMIQVIEGQATLHATPARLFRKGQDPIDLQPGDAIDHE